MSKYTSKLSNRLLDNNPSIVVLMGYTVLAVSYFQHTLILLENFSYLVHWTVILFLIPTINGALAYLLVRNKAYQISFISSFSSAIILYFLYRNLFWKIPPNTFHTLTLFSTITFFSVFGVTSTRFFSGRLKSNHKRKRRLPKKSLIYVYHGIAFLSAVLTILGFFMK